MQSIRECLKDQHFQAIEHLQSKLFGLQPSAEASSPQADLADRHAAALESCIEQIVLGSILQMVATPHAALATEIKHQTEYFLLAVDGARVEVRVGGTVLQPPLALSVLQDDSACDAVTASATAFVCNTLHLEPQDTLTHVAAAVGAYITAVQPHEHSVDKHCFPLADVLKRIKSSHTAHTWADLMQQSPFTAARGNIAGES